MPQITPFQVLELHPRSPRSCFRCEYFQGGVTRGGDIVCTHPKLSPVVSQPEFGCASWMRAIGADDE